MIIAIAGNICSGKTSLAKYLAHALRFHPIYEDTEGNPYFLQTCGRGHLAANHYLSQLCFLTNKLASLLKIIPTKPNIILDRTLIEDSQVFAKYHFNNGNLTKEQWQLYNSIYTTAISSIPKPDLILFLEIYLSEIYRRLSERNAPWDCAVSIPYLEQIDDLYRQLVVDSSFRPLRKYKQSTSFEVILEDIKNFVK